MSEVNQAKLDSLIQDSQMAELTAQELAEISGGISLHSLELKHCNSNSCPHGIPVDLIRYQDRILIPPRFQFGR